MNCKGLTDEQIRYLRDHLLMQVEPDDAATLLPLLEASVGRIAAHAVRRHNAEALAEGLRLTEHIPGGGTVGRLAYVKAVRSLRHDDLEHVIDWLKAAVMTDAPWLRNVDTEGRPRKLLKCSTYADLMREADKAMDRLNAQRAKALGPGDERHVADLEQGFILVRLLTPEALDLESWRMKHCVGHGSYDGGVADGSIEIYSLRDPLGRPVVTIEVEHDTVNLDGFGVLAAEPRTQRVINQVQGRRNEEPDPEHLAILRPFVRASEWKDADHWWPTVTDADGVEHDVAAIPPGTVFAKFYLSPGEAASSRIRLPEGLTVTGDCYIAGPLCGALPEGMTVGGDLYLNPDGPVTLRRSLRVKGKVILWDESVVAAPEHLRDRIESRAIHVVRGDGGGPVPLVPLRIRFEDCVSGQDPELVVDEDPDPAPSP